MSTVVSYTERPTEKEPRHELLEHRDRSPRGSGELRSGSVNKCVCRPMDSPSKTSARRWFFEGLIPVRFSVARREYASNPKHRKNGTGRPVILGLVLAARGHVQGDVLAERGETKFQGSGLGSSTAGWSMRPPGGELMRPKAETRIVLLVDGVWAVPLRSGPYITAGGELLRTKSRDEEFAPKRSVIRT